MRTPYHLLRSAFKLGLAAACLALLAGCAAFNYTQTDAPQALAQVSPITPRPRIAVVLSSGGPRGYAHIGVIKALEQAGIFPDRKFLGQRLIGSGD
jgi:NTE family protein